MAKLERVTAKVFASDAPADKIGQFGSALAGTKLETGDVSTIQALPAYTEGWSSAVISQRNYPVLQETNGVMKNMSYQTAYIMQNGIAEYDPDTKYYAGSICKGIGNTNQYASWGDENVGNDVTNSQYWKNVTPVNYSNITNCLLEIPQRIKYDLTDGTLTIKAGSVVIVPYGTEDLTSQYPVGATFLNDNFKVYDTQFADGKFFVWAELLSDYSHSKNGSDGTYVVTISPKANRLVGTVQTSSGIAIGSDDMHYHTDMNKINVYTNSTIAVEDCALPMYILTRTTTEVTAVNQVFNGIGYIGSTVWRDKGVKSLAVNGRNEDGSYNSIEHISNDIKVYTVPTTETGEFYIGLSNGNLTHLSPSVWTYNDELNSIEVLGSPIYDITFAGTFTASSGVITSFNPKQPFRAVDYNDKPTVSGWGMPSSKYINLTFGASGSSYTAPANGYFCAVATAGADKNYLDIRNLTTNSLGMLTVGGSAAQGLRAFVPALKGQTVALNYSSSLGSNREMFFVYSKGEV